MEHTNSITYIPVEQLLHHPNNPRKELGDLSELADSIRQNGIMQNLTVVVNGDQEGTYLVVIGNRRMEAAKLAGLESAPCVIADMTEREQLATMLLENMQRQDLTVYEQAQGFQQMLQFGETPESIAEKTGFSTATVRRRLKMGELDQKILKDVSYRQPSLEDFDKLAKIADLKVRNRLLQDIGTNNFNSRVEYAFKEQEITRVVPKVKAAIKAERLHKINQSDTWSDKYEQIRSISLFDWPEGSLVPEGETRQVYYFLNESLHVASLRLYVEAPKKKPRKRPQAEIEREKRAEDAVARFEAARRIAYELRKKFFDELVMTKANESQFLAAFANLVAVHTVEHVSTPSAAELIEAVGGRDVAWDQRIPFLLEKIAESPARVIPRMLYHYSGDNVRNGYGKRWGKEFPHHESNAALDVLYAFMTKMGYAMSDEEIALQKGTHEVFHQEDKK